MLHAPKAADELDAEGWSPLHHAVNACSWSWRAMKAALALVPLTPKKIINHPTTRSQPEGFTCRHFASEGSDKVYERARLVRALVERQANLEAKSATGNTALLLASGTGVVDIIDQLVDCGADVNAKNNRGLGAYQNASQCSRSAKTALKAYGACWKPSRWVPSASQRSGVSSSRAARWMQRGDHWDWARDHQWRAWNDKWSDEVAWRDWNDQWREWNGQ